MNFNSLFILLAFAFLPVLFWLILYYRQDYRDLEPRRVILQLFLIGMLAALPFLLLRYLLAIFPFISWMSGVVGVIIFAALEEMTKLSAAVFVIDRRRVEFNQLVDGIIYLVAVALGFAFVESLFYLTAFLWQSLTWSSFIIVAAFRGFGTVLAHTLFSGIIGFIWAYAYFSTQISPFQKKHILAFELEDWLNREVFSLHIIRHNLLKARPSRRGGHEKRVLVMEGLFLGVILHSVFNLMTTFEIWGQHLTFLLVPFLMGGLMLMGYLFHKKFNHKIFKVV